MEVGAVKQAFNNELISMKKKLNQAKIQIIHKLTRKAKTLTDKKVPEKLKGKLNKKAESAVKEVLIIKKIKPRDIAKFCITHTEELKHYLNKPTVDQDKACARLLLHKAMQEKYKFIRGRFANVPIKDLFMSRQERLKLKKEARDKQKNKKKGKGDVTNPNEWKIEDIDMKNDSNDKNDDETRTSNDDDGDNESHAAQEDSSSNVSENESDISEELNENLNDTIANNELNDNNENDIIEESITNKQVKMKERVKNTNKIKESEQFNFKINSNNVLKPQKKNKDINKNKNLNEKLQKGFKKDAEDTITEKKVIDPFFITATGEKYMSVAEPRQPDEVKEIHKQGNRKLRRAAMFGHVPKIKPKRDFEENNFNYNSTDKGNFRNKFSNSGNNSHINKDTNKFNDKKSNLKDKIGFNNRNKVNSDNPEKLHPSWEAKKRQSGILPFQGKKIVFDES